MDSSNAQFNMTEPQFFQFEADFTDSLRCIPMAVRMNLDTCGIKLKLDQWNAFSDQERQQLVHLPCSTAAESEAYRQQLKDLVWQHTQVQASELPIDDHPAWLNLKSVPQLLQEKAEAHGLEVTVEQWRSLTPLQRFALLKLTRPSHESNNFLPALREFQLLPE
ncbi:MAG: nitrate reductase associated protein [Thermosynechococcaceae cyanobacterium]